MAAVTSPARHAASLATSASNREPRQSKVHRAMEWLKPSSARSSGTMSASVRARMQTPLCTSSQPGLSTTILHRNTHLSTLLKRRDFVDQDAIPWGVLSSVVRDERYAGRAARQARCG